MPRYVLGCDVGSQGLKTILLREDGTAVAESYEAYPISHPRPAWAEQDAGAWFSALTNTIRKVVAETSVDPSSIVALGVDSQVDGVVAVDRRGTPLYPAIIWMDRRATRECEALADLEQRIFDITGVNLDASHVAPKIMWLRRNEPSVYEKAWRFLLPGSFILYRLTGQLGVDYSNASSTMLMDVTKKQWSDELLRATGIDKDRLAPILPATKVVGTLLPAVADLLGLSNDVQVVVGCGDEHAACVGAGVIATGYLCDIVGTAEPVCVASTLPVFDDTKLVETHCHADPDLWLIENPGFVSGGNYNWFKSHFASEEQSVAGRMGKSPYDLLNAEASHAPPGSEGLVFIPCLMGAMTPEWNSYARGAFFGITLKHGKGHFIRAIMEGSAYGLKDILTRIEAMGIPVDEIRVVGGGAKGDLWRQIRADVTGKVVAVPAITETTSLGAAMVAAVGTGIFTSFPEAAGACVRIVERRQPMEKNEPMYREMYQLYRQVYASLKPCFKTLADIQAQENCVKD
ncbi:MAG: xylulokinase [Bacillota bacterium]